MSYMAPRRSGWGLGQAATMPVPAPPLMPPTVTSGAVRPLSLEDSALRWVTESGASRWLLGGAPVFIDNQRWRQTFGMSYPAEAGMMLFNSRPGLLTVAAMTGLGYYGWRKKRSWKGAAVGAMLGAAPAALGLGTFMYLWTHGR